MNEDTVSETSSMKHTPPTMAKETKRVFRKPIIPCPGLALTPQIVLSDSCNWPKTPLAPKSATTTPTTVPMIPAFGFLALEQLILPRFCGPGGVLG